MNWFSVRKVIALVLTGVFSYLSIIGKVDVSNFIPIFSIIVGYYFGKSTALDIPKTNTKEKEGALNE